MLFVKDNLIPCYLSRHPHKLLRILIHMTKSQTLLTPYIVPTRPLHNAYTALYTTPTQHSTLLPLNPAEIRTRLLLNSYIRPTLLHSICIPIYKYIPQVTILSHCQCRRTVIRHTVTKPIQTVICYVQINTPNGVNQLTTADPVLFAH